MENNTRSFWLPTIPCTLIETINRMAAATGSMRYASLASHADYNGHYVTVSFNEYRGYWVTRYTWMGDVVLARGDLSRCLQAAKDKYSRGAKGSTVVVKARNDEDAAIIAAAGFAPWSDEIAKAHYASYTDARFAEVNSAMNYEKHGLAPAVGFLANSKTIEEYNEKLESFFAERKAARAR